MTIRGMLLALVVLLPILAVRPDVAEARARILLVFDEDKDFPGLATINHSLRKAFTTDLGSDVEFYSESLNLSQFPGPDHEGVLLDHFLRKYAGVPLDLIVAVMDPSVEFLLRHRALFPGVPIVLCGAERVDLQGRTLGADVTGVVVKRDYAPTLEIALKLHPDTRNVFVVGGASRFDQRIQTIARRDFARFERRVVISYLTGLSMGDLLARVSRLPPNSVIVHLTLFADSAGFAFIPHDALSRVAQAANAPVYAAVDQFIGRGAVGGHVYSFDKHGRHAAEIGLRILRGESAASIPIVEPEAYTDLFDWRQLRRWGIDERRLPAGSVVRFRAPSAWDQYKWYIASGVLVLVVQTTLIAGLLVNRIQRRRTQRTLDERLKFETLLSQLSAELLTMPASTFDHAVERMLQRVVETLDFDRAALAERVDGTLRTRHAWTRPGIAPVPAGLAESTDFPWLRSRMTGGEVVRVSRLDDLPEAAATDRQSLAGRGIRALAALPLLADGAVVGALAFSRLRGEHAWPDELTARLQLLADVFANVLARRRADEAVRTSEELRRQAEEEALRQRDELAHAGRVSMLSTLSSSLAHELSQPLSAILVNIGSSNRLLDRPDPDLKELREILDDLRRDARHAGEVIDRWRSLLKRRNLAFAPVSVEGLLKETSVLLKSDAIARNVTLEFDSEVGMPMVHGDRIHLSQVLINLIINGMDAVAGMPADRRYVSVRAHVVERGCVELAIRDSGSGILPDALERIFEPFYTTKATGMGMGLSVSRTIVEAHGGQMWAENGADRGATFRVRLPVVK